MPKIPRIQPSLNTLTTDSPNAIKRDPGVTGRALQQIGGAMSDAGEMFKQATLLVEKTKAQNDLETRLADIRTRAEQDPDTSQKRRQEYDNEINKATADSSKFITHQEEKNIYSLQAQNKANISKANIDGIYHTKTVNELKANSDLFFDNKKNDYIKAMNPKVKEMAVVDRNNQIDMMVKAGALEPAQAITLKENQDKDWQKSQVEYDITTNPQMAKELLKKTEDGGNQYGVPEEDRAKYVSQANQAIERNEQIALRDRRESTLTADRNITKLFIEGDLSVEKLQEFKDTASPSILERMFKNLTSSRTINNKTKSETFNKIQDDFSSMRISADDKTDADLNTLATFKSDVLDAMETGDLTQDDGRRFLRMVSVAYDEKLTNQAKVEATKQPWKLLHLWANANSPDVKEAKERLGRELMDRVSGGENGEDALKNVLDGEKKRINPNFKKYEPGQVINTQRGPVKVVGFDDDGEPLVEPMNKPKAQSPNAGKTK